MAIKTVNQDNLAEYVAEKRGDVKPDVPSETPATTDGPTPGNPVITSGTDSVDTAPDPGEQKKQDATEKSKAGTEPAVQRKIDSLTREKKELEEFAESEYTTRLRAENRIAELEKRINELQPKQAEPELVKPDPSKYTDQQKFLDDFADYNRKLAREEFRKEQEAAELRRMQAERQKLLSERVERARANIEDFDTVIKTASRQSDTVPQHIQEAIEDLEYGPEVAYLLAKDSAERKRIFGLSRARAIAEIGKLETQFAKPAKAEEPKAVTQTPETTKAPAPISKLRSDAGIVSTDLSQAMSFNDYKRQRLQQQRELRQAGRRR